MNLAYEATPTRGFKTKTEAKKALSKMNVDINKMSSFRIMWFLIKRHKFAILATTCFMQTLALFGVLPILIDLVRR